MATVKELKTEFRYTRTGDAWGETPDLVRFGNILERHARRVRHAGLDY